MRVDFGLPKEEVIKDATEILKKINFKFCNAKNSGLWEGCYNSIESPENWSCRGLILAVYSNQTCSDKMIEGGLSFGIINRNHPNQDLSSF